MNKIVCDNCKEQINPTIETKYLTGDITIQFFRCNSCKEKYLIDVTDKSTREKQIYLVKKQKYQGQLAETITKYNLEILGQEMTSNNEAIEKLLKEIRETKAELKIKYEGEL